MKNSKILTEIIILYTYASFYFMLHSILLVMLLVVILLVALHIALLLIIFQEHAILTFVVSAVFVDE